MKMGITHARSIRNTGSIRNGESIRIKRETRYRVDGENFAALREGQDCTGISNSGYIRPCRQIPMQMEIEVSARKINHLQADNAIIRIENQHGCSCELIVLARRAVACSLKNVTRADDILLRNRRCGQGSSNHTRIVEQLQMVNRNTVRHVMGKIIKAEGRDISRTWQKIFTINNGIIPTQN